MMQDEGETETRATFEIIPDEVRMHIARYLDMQSLCFFAITSRRNLGNALAELKQRRRRMLAQMPLQAGGGNTFCYTPQGLYACGHNGYRPSDQERVDHCSRFSRIEHVPGTILQVAVGGRHTLVLTSQGLYAFGSNTFGQLGLGNKKNRNRLTRVEPVQGTILQVVAGDSHTLVLTDQGLYACGKNTVGQLGLRHKKNRNRLTQVEPVQGTILQVVAGYSHTLMLTDQGLYACGNNEYGQLGLGHNNGCNQLTRVENVPGTILKVMASGHHIFVLTDQGLYACGMNQLGELGLKHNKNCNRLTRVEDLPGTILQMTAGYSHTLVLTDQGLYACGSNQSGQLGLGNWDYPRRKLTRVKGVQGTILQVVAGRFHTLVLTDQGLYACGDNRYGQLGLNNENDRSTFIRLSNLPIELKQWLSLWRHLNHLIAISTNDATYEQGGFSHLELRSFKSDFSTFFSELSSFFKNLTRCSARIADEQEEPEALPSEARPVKRI